jgi:hypothetical protein
MESSHEISHSLDRSPVTGFSEPPSAGPEDSRLNIVVIFTSTAATTAALQTAVALAESLGSRITLIVPQVVPYPLPLTSPPVLLDFQENRLRDIASQSTVDTRVQLCLCRDELEMLVEVLPANSLIIMGRSKRWWPSHESKLARKLRSRHEIVFAETK